MSIARAGMAGHQRRLDAYRQMLKRLEEAELIRLSLIFSPDSAAGAGEAELIAEELSRRYTLRASEKTWNQVARLFGDSSRFNDPGPARMKQKMLNGAHAGMNLARSLGRTLGRPWAPFQLITPLIVRGANRLRPELRQRFSHFVAIFRREATSPRLRFYSSAHRRL